MRFGLGWTVALLIGAAGAAPAQAPLVYRIDVSGTVELSHADGFAEGDDDRP